MLNLSAHNPSNGNGHGDSDGDSATAVLDGPAPVGPDTGDSDVVRQQRPELHDAQRIAAGLWAVDLQVKRPSGKYQIKQVEVRAQNGDGEIEALEAGKVTKPSFICDTKNDHPLWEQLDENQRQFDATLRIFSVNDARRGFHLVPSSKVGDMLAAFDRLREQRIGLATQLRDDCEAWCANLQHKFSKHWHLLKPLLPKPEELVEKFDVIWIPQELTAADPSRIKFKDVNPADRERVIESSRQMIQELGRQRAQVIYEAVFGEVLAKCDEIAAGALETGKRKFGAITEVVELVQRLKNFDEFANQEIVQRADHVLETLEGITDIRQINQNEGENRFTRAIRTAMRPLGEAVEEMMESVRPGSMRRSAASITNEPIPLTTGKTRAARGGSVRNRWALLWRRHTC